MTAGRAALCLAGALVSASSAGCGGGAALLHEAHTLPPGVTNVGGGLSGTFVGGAARDAVRDARSTATDEAYARGALAVAGLGPGVAPWIGARVGLENDLEAGITYTGQGARVDGRYALVSTPSVAFSAGLGASFALPRAGANDSDQIGGLRLGGQRGYGADVPLLLGWRSSSNIAAAWIGPRAGFERLAGTVTLGSAESSSEGDMTIDRMYAGGVVGLSFGFRYVHAALELDVYGESVHGTLVGNDVRVSGLTIAPASALIATF